MSDRAVRDLERAFQGGDPAALPLLVAAYLRRGERAAALTLLGRHRALAPDLQALEAEGWRGTLARLQPVRRVPGVRPYAGVCGWIDARTAALAVRRAPLPREVWALAFVEREGGAFHEVPQAVRWYGPVTTLGAIVGEATPGNADLAAPVLIGYGPRDPRREVLGPLTAAQVRAAARDAQSLVWTWTRRRLAGHEAGEVRWTDRAGTEEVSVPGTLVAFDAERGRLTYRVGSELRWLERGETPEQARSLAVADLEYDRFTELAGGLLLAHGSTLRLIDLDRRSVTPVGRATQRASGPFVLARARDAVFAATGRGPVRLGLGLGVGPGARDGPAYSGFVCWHPRAEAVALVPETGPAELLAWDGRRFVRLLRFPPDARPLGWSPDGRALLVVRRVGEQGGLLEVWEARS